MYYVVVQKHIRAGLHQGQILYEVTFHLSLNFMGIYLAQRYPSLIVRLFGENIFVISYKTIYLALWDKNDYKTIKYNKDI